MTWTVQIANLDGSTRIASLPWTTLSFTHVLNAPGSVEIGVSIAKVSRADIEPGQSDYLISQDGTPRAEGRIWDARVDTNANTLTASLTGEGIAGILAKRLVDQETRYEPVTESPTNINTQYGLSQEEILADLIAQTQAEDGGDLGITPGAHTGGTHLRRRWWCREDGVYLAEVFDDFSGLSDGIDWAISPTLTDPGSRELVTFNPHRGTDLSGSIVLDGSVYLDNLSYEVDAGQIVTRGRSVAEGDCDPSEGDVTDAAALADYGLLEAFEGANSDQQEDANEIAAMQVSPHPVVGMDVPYQLSNGPALGTFDVGDRVRVVSDRPGWPLDITAHVQEIEVMVQLPDDDEHTFVRVNVSEWFEETVAATGPLLVAAKGRTATTSDLYSVDPTGAGETSIGAIGFAVTSIAQDPTTGIIYASTSNNSAAHPHSLITIDPVTGAGTFIAAFSSGQPMPALAFSPSGVLLGLRGNQDGNLISINTTTAVETVLGSSAPTSNVRMAFAGSDLWAIVNSSDVGTLDQSTGALTVIYSPAFTSNVTMHAVTFKDGLLWAIDHGAVGVSVTANLLTVAIAGGTLTYIGLLATTNLAALAWVEV